MKPKKSEKTQMSIEAQYKIRGVKDIKFVFWPEKAEINEDDIQLSLFFFPRIEEKQGFLIIGIGVKMIIEGRESVEYISETLFELKNFSDIITNIEHGRFDISEEFVVEFGGIALSIVRGVLVEKLSGTVLSHIVLPLIPKEEVRRNILNANKAKSA